MTSAGIRVLIRQPILIQAYIGAFLLFWLGGVVWTAFIEHHGWSVVVGSVFVAFGVALGWRLLRLSVRSHPGGTLTIRNTYSDRHLTRQQIQEFRLGRNGGIRIGQSSVQALLDDRSVYALDVCRTPLGFRAKRLSRQLEQLNSWLHSTD